MPEIYATVDDSIIAVWGGAVWPRVTCRKHQNDFAELDTGFSVGDRLAPDLSTSTTHGNDMTNVQGAVAPGVLFYGRA